MAKLTFAQHMRANWIAYLLSFITVMGPATMGIVYHWVDNNERAINSATLKGDILRQKVDDLQAQVNRECHP